MLRKAISSFLLLGLAGSNPCWANTAVMSDMAQEMLNACLNSSSIRSNECTIILQQNLYTEAYIENQRRLIELKEKKFKYQQEQDKKREEQQKQVLRQQRIAELHKYCTSGNIPPASQAQCNAVENHLNFGLPIADEQLGIP